MAALQCDVGIIGGGLVGSGLLLALADSGLRIVQIDANPAPSIAAISASTRYLALNRFSLDVLHRLNVLQPHRSGARIEEILISRAGEFGRVHLRARDHGLDFFGQMVPSTELASAFHSACEAAAKADPALHVVRSASLQSLTQHEHGISALCQTESGPLELECAVVVGADGSDSSVRKHCDMQLAANQRNYDEQALVFNFSVERPQPGLAIERFTDAGPLAVLPINKNQCGAVWTLPAERARTMANASDTVRLASLQQALGSVLGRVSAPSTPSCWPLRLCQSAPDYAQRAVLIGNAAQTIHPLGAQGFNLGLRDALALASYLRKNLRAGHPQSAASAQFFQAYSQDRAPDRQRTVQFSDGLLAATSSQAGLTALLRRLGMAALAHTPLAQREVIRFGLGYSRGGVQTP
jgi:2-octaprenyl-6-methoxyphenol hydroxylase